MSYKSVILCAYMHLFNNIVLANDLTAILIILSVFLFYYVSQKSMRILLVKIKLVVLCIKNC